MTETSRDETSLRAKCRQSSFDQQNTEKPPSNQTTMEDFKQPSTPQVNQFLHIYCCFLSAKKNIQLQMLRI